MKTLFLIPTILLLIVGHCYSQTTFVPQIGISQSKIVNDKEDTPCVEKIFDEKFDYTSPTYGVKVIQRISKEWSVYLGVNYKQGGSKTVGIPCAFDSGLNWVTHSYLDFNSGLEFTPVKNSWVEFGVYNSLLLDAKWEVVTIAGAKVVEVKNGYSDFDTGLQAGIGYIFFNKIRLGLLYQHGLKNTVETDKNRWIFLNLGYALQFWK